MSSGEHRTSDSEDGATASTRPIEHLKQSRDPKQFDRLAKIITENSGQERFQSWLKITVQTLAEIQGNKATEIMSNGTEERYERLLLSMP